MNMFDWLQLILYVGALGACVRPLGAFMARIYEGRPPRFIARNCS